MPMAAAVHGVAWARAAAAKVGVLGATGPEPVVALVAPETPAEVPATLAMGTALVVVQEARAAPVAMVAPVATGAATVTLAVLRVVTTVDLAAPGELGAATAAVVLEDTAGMVVLEDTVVVMADTGAVGGTVDELTVPFTIR